MKNSQVFGIFVLVLNFWATAGTVLLDEFLKAVEDARSELQELDGHLRRRRATVGELLARFGDGSDAPEGGDAWYQSFRAMECQVGGCPKKPLRWVSVKAQPEDYYDYYEDAVDAMECKDQAANDLSHEANYKLSKIEQEAAEKGLPVTKWRSLHDVRQSAGPIDVGKLETGPGMLENGQGSSNLFDEEIEGGIPWKGRKLMAKEDLDRELGGFEFDNAQVRSDKDIKKTTLRPWKGRKLMAKEDLDRELGGLVFDNAQVRNEQDIKKTTFSEELPRTAAFEKLQKFLKESQTNKSFSRPPSNNQKAPTVPLNLVEKDRDVNINLHMSVNATVLGEDNLPEEFHRNKTFSFKNPVEETHEQEEASQDRDRRRVDFPIMAEPGVSGEFRKSREDIPQDETISGSSTLHLVESVFALVKESPNLKVLWPGLMRNRLPLPSDLNFDAIRTEDNESELRRSETMICQAMEAINAIIDQEARSRSCVPLPSDLKAFLDLATRNLKEDDRHKRESGDGRNPDDITLSDSHIRNKSKIVKKLLRDYEELPREDREQVFPIKRSLLIAAEQLREMQQRSKRRKRHMSAALHQSNIDEDLSPEFVKLAKTAAQLSKSTLTDPDFSFI